MLRVSEIYASTQGEGQNVGRMTIFCRFAGCNMRCPGWPCDTEHAINPAIWRTDSTKENAASVVTTIVKRAEMIGAHNICFTGGEPFVQPHDELGDVAQSLWDTHDYRMEWFTNGSYDFPDWVIDTSDIMMDWKLAGSGEAQTHREVRSYNALRLKPSDGVKFVVVDAADIEESKRVQQQLEEDGCEAEFWIAPAWDRIEPSVVVECMKDLQLNMRLNLQVHKYVWPADARGV